MSRIRTLIIQSAAAALSLALLLAALPAAVYASGSGSAGTLSWVLDAGGTLTVSGGGEMPDYADPAEAPWEEVRDEIRAVVVEDGVTSVGCAAFYGCENLTRVTLAESVAQVGEYAFAECLSLLSVEMPGAVAIGRDAFRYCTSLTAVSLPETLTTLGTEAFYRCESLVTVAVPASVTEMGSSVFAYCTSLTQASVNAAIDTLPAWTFYGCQSLTAAALGEGITGAGENAFSGCQALASLSCGADGADALLAAAQEGGAALDEESVNGASAAGSYTYRDVEEELVSEGMYRIRSRGVLSRDSCVISDEILYLLDTGTLELTAQERTLSVTLWSEDALSDVEEYLNVIAGTAESDELSGVIPVETAAVGLVELTMTGGESVLTRAFLQAVTDSGADLKVTMDTGVVWEMENADLAAASFYKSYDLGVELTAQESLGSGWKKILGDAQTVQVGFASNVNFRCSVTLPFDSSHAGHIVSLFSNRNAEPLQSVYVGLTGSVTFLFADINSGRTYMAGIDVEGVDAGGVLSSSEDGAN
ncbi:MAG: leucine-rich repeat domain-containing protein, partial [Oscillospiraceae bacterium]|nr:leucine-rich repeat domain-containing protein [Oscillospiraceae bacterium]